jgi:hypothetical protein
LDRCDPRLQGHVAAIRISQDAARAAFPIRDYEQLEAELKTATAGSVATAYHAAMTEELDRITAGAAFRGAFAALAISRFRFDLPCSIHGLIIMFIFYIP